MNYGTLQHFQGWILFDMQRSGVQTARYSQQSFSHLFSWSHEIIPLIPLKIVWGLIAQGDFCDRGIPDDPWGSVLQSPALSSARPSVAALHQQMPRLVADWHSCFFKWGTNHGWFLVGLGSNKLMILCYKPLTSLNIKHSNLGAPCLQTITIRDTTQTIDKPPDQAHLRP